MSFLVGALIAGAIASITGSIVSAISQANANETNKELTRETNSANQAIAQASTQFSAEEAEKNRQFQLYMSNTAHQREVADLKAAGLNPYMSIGSNGAEVTGGSVAQPTTAQMQAARVGSLGDVTGLSSLASLAQSAAFMMALGARSDAGNSNMKEIAALNNKNMRDIATFNKHGYWPS